LGLEGLTSVVDCDKYEPISVKKKNNNNNNKKKPKKKPDNPPPWVAEN